MVDGAKSITNKKWLEQNRSRLLEFMTGMNSKSDYKEFLIKLKLLMSSPCSVKTFQYQKHGYDHLILINQIGMVLYLTVFV